MKTILSLFDYSKNWSNPYQNAGYPVIAIDIKNEIDILKWDYTQITQVHGILAAPPCERFTKASAHLWKKYDDSGKTEEALQLVDKTLEIINYFKPKWWALENPPGRLPDLRPELKRHRLIYFHPYYYGDPYAKQTELFGHFNPFLSLNLVTPLPPDQGNSSIDVHHGTTQLKYKDRKTLRSETPSGFANSFFKANP